MGRGLCYADAVRLLGGRESKTVVRLDQLTGGVLLAATGMAGAAGALALSLFDAKGELARLSGELARGVGDQLRGLGRLDRTDRLAAAHAVVVVTAYFESISAVRPPFARKDLEFSAAEQVSLVGGGEVRPLRLHTLARELLRAAVPMPTPQQPYEVTLRVLGDFYVGLSAEVFRFVSGLPAWAAVDAGRQLQMRDVLHEELPRQAVGRYEELLRRLSVDLPEVAFWVNHVEHQATRAELRRLNRGLAGVGEILARLSSEAVPSQLRAGLARAYRADLGRPIIPATEAPEGLRIPPLEDIYVTPDFRVAEAGPAERIAEESWWAERPVREDLQEFLLGHFTAPHAAAAPLLVLGQPGSGKSVLTRVLAARLPPGEFLVVRVALREAPADVDLQSQVEHAVRAATGEDLSWPELARTAGGALPVVLLDGFDELLQATGVNQTDYLERVAAFQRREADQGRPTAMVVTSRTAVADRARCTTDTVVIRLEPFRQAQIAQWLDVWNDANAHCLASRGLRPLPVEAVGPHAELAAQPLLLMMLALYDSDSNALQLDTARLGHAELYERLLDRFARREVSKSDPGLPAAQLNREVERELLRLSVVAFAMSNRGRQWVIDADLDADLQALLPDSGGQPSPTGLRAALTAADVVVGRFFFVHEGQATRDDVRLRTYEFLHATFGEYLVARLVARELADLAEAAELSAGRSRPAPADDAFLHALLSFSVVTVRGITFSFLQQLLESLPAPRRGLLRGLLISLFHGALYARHDTRYAEYEPRRLPVTSRHANYSANLILLAVLVGGEVTGKELFPHADKTQGRGGVWGEWRTTALLWRSQLMLGEGWHGLLATLELERTWEGGNQGIRLRLATDLSADLHIDPYWTYRMPPGSSRRGLTGWHEHHETDLRRMYYFLCDRRIDVAAHAVEPLVETLGSAFVTFHGVGEDSAVSAAAALVRLWLAIDGNSSEDDLTAAYDACLAIALNGFSPDDTAARGRYQQMLFRMLTPRRRTPSAAWLDEAAKKIGEAARTDPDLRKTASELLPELRLENH